MDKKEKVCRECKYGIEVDPNQLNKNSTNYCSYHNIYTNQKDECLRWEDKEWTTPNAE